MVNMERLPDIPPTMRMVSVQFDSLFCVITTSNDPYQDNGDYDWGSDGE